MTKLRLGRIEDDKPVRITVELPAAVHRDLVQYAQLLTRESGQGEMAPAKLIPPMLARFMEGDRVFSKARRIRVSADEQSRG